MGMQNPGISTPTPVMVDARRSTIASAGVARPSAGATRRATAGFPPTALVVLSACSLELGGALAKTLFATLGPVGTVTVRVGLAAAMLLLAWRPNLRRAVRVSLGMVLLFGISLAAMNLTFYLALSRVPLGVAVTIELLGPLSVAACGTRRPRDLLWVLVAAIGVAAFAPLGTPKSAALDPLGIALCLLSGAFTAAYILMSARTGRSFTNGDGLALAMLVAAIVLLPLGIPAAGPALLLYPRLLVTGAGVAMLSSVVPYSLEIAALRRLPTYVFGVLVSLEPAIAALTGWLILHEQLGVRALVGIAVVTVASAGAAYAGHSGHAKPRRA
jgi:inner membrane transporter RhtA